MENVWFVGGGSGHGFKHGPAFGEYVTRHILDRIEPNGGFRWRQKQPRRIARYINGPSPKATLRRNFPLRRASCINGGFVFAGLPHHVVDSKGIGRTRRNNAFDDIEAPELWLCLRRYCWFAARWRGGAIQRRRVQVPVEYYKLPNGLRVVLSPDHTAPTVCVGVYYRIGFRIEPKDRTGFAHLFEHMMFQGSQNLGKMEFIKLVQQNGGILNGSTRFDFTNYFEVLPSNKLETALWAEADRMSGLAVTEENLKNQQGVVGNEVKVNVLNRPYGGFPWLDMPQYANTNWYNAHNFYGDLKDIEAATLTDVKQFFKTYYAPNNAALAIVGDFDPAEAKKLVEKYFGGIKASNLPPSQI